MTDTQSTTDAPASGLAERRITAFICTSAARAGRAPSSARPRPERPDFNWPCAAQEVLIPCTGRLQPEHLLKALEAGTDAVVIVACDEDNCHNLEGSRRALLRVDHVRQILNEIGLGGERVMLFHLPGSAREDMALGTGETPAAAPPAEEMAKRLAQIRQELATKLQTLAPNPLGRMAGAPAAGEVAYELDETEEGEE